MCRDLPETAVSSERPMGQRKQSLHPEEGLRRPPGQVPPHCWSPVSHLLGQPRPLRRSQACSPRLWLPSWPGSIYFQTTRSSVSLSTPGESQVMWRTPAHLENPAQSHRWSQHPWSADDPITLSHTGSHLPATWLQAQGMVRVGGRGWRQAHHQAPWGMCQCPGAAVTNGRKVSVVLAQLWRPEVPDQGVGGTTSPAKALREGRPASSVLELRTSRCTSWVSERQRNQTSNCQHPLDHQKNKRVPGKHLLLFY